MATASYTFTGENSFPAARTASNVRGRDILSAPEFAETITKKASFSVSIVNGHGEVFLKKINGVWHEQVHSVDRCFGNLKSRWNPVRI
jgi:hypothetical protein